MGDHEPAVPAGRGRSSGPAALAEALAALPGMPIAELRAEWRRLFKVEAPPRLGRSILELGVAWKLQERVYGGHSAKVRRRLAELAAAVADGGDLAPSPAQRLRPGTVLVREWHGQIHQVHVRDDGFEWHGRHWRSLSAIARAITGANWSGPRFFGLLKPPARRTGRESDGSADKAPHA